MQRVFMIAAAVALVACAAKSTTAPADFNVSGSWSGSIADAQLGNGALSLTLVQTGDSVTGTWAMTYADTLNDVGGRAIGHVIGSTLSVLLRPLSPPTCQFGPFQVTATETSGTALTGAYTTVQCPAPDSGSMSVMIQ